MIFSTLHCEIANLDQTHNPVDLVEELLRLIEEKLAPSPADKFQGKTDNIINCILSGGIAITSSTLFIIKTTVAQHLAKAIEG
jgi:hypothetical protein